MHRLLRNTNKKTKAYSPIVTSAPSRQAGEAAGETASSPPLPNRTSLTPKSAGSRASVMSVPAGVAPGRDLGGGPREAATRTLILVPCKLTMLLDSLISCVQDNHGLGRLRHEPESARQLPLCSNNSLVLARGLKQPQDLAAQLEKRLHRRAAERRDALRTSGLGKISIRTHGFRLLGSGLGRRHRGRAGRQGRKGVTSARGLTRYPAHWGKQRSVNTDTSVKRLCPPRLL